MTARWTVGRRALLAAAMAGCGYPALPVVTADGALADGSAVDAAGPPPSSPILLSEVVLAPTEGEMIEIVNTSNQDVDLSTYYLSDSGNYYRLPVGTTVDATDFIAKFPDGTVIPGHGVFTIALDTPAMFASTYQMTPTFSLADGTMKVIVANPPPTLTNGGEPVILFRWDGHSDLVTDIDIMIVGTPAAMNLLTSKSGMSQDGPDPDSSPSTYATDASTIKPQAMPPPPPNLSMTPIQVFSTQRILLEDGHEDQGHGGNGPSGDDETSEDTSITWDGTAVRPFGLATPGTVPAALLR